MIHVALGHQNHSLCCGLRRRDFLRVGSLAPFGPSWAGLFAATKGEAQSVQYFRQAAKSVILIFLVGGISYPDSLDPKT